MAKEEKKKDPVRIVPRHRRVLKNYIEGGMVSLKQAIKKEGYSDIVAETPANITLSKSWSALLREYLPEDLLAQRHNELLGKREFEFVEEPDPSDPKGKRRIMVKKDIGPHVGAVSKALEMAYKLRGSYAPEVTPSSMNIYNLFYKPEVRESMRAFEEGLKKNIIHESDTNKDQGVPNTEAEGDPVS